MPYIPTMYNERQPESNPLHSFFSFFLCSGFESRCRSLYMVLRKTIIWGWKKSKVYLLAVSPDSTNTLGKQKSSPLLKWRIKLTCWCDVAETVLLVLSLMLIRQKHLEIGDVMLLFVIKVKTSTPLESHYAKKSFKTSTNN